MSLVPPSATAAQIVNAQRRNYSECSVPRPWLFINASMRNLPDKVIYQFKEFLDSGVDADS